MALPAILTNPMLYIAIGALVFLGIAYKVPFVGKLLKSFGPRTQTAVIFIVVGLFLMGTFSSVLDIFSVAPGTAPGVAVAGVTGGVATVTSVDITTSFATDGPNSGCTIEESTTVDNLFYVKCTDAQTNETGGINELDTGIFTLTRSGAAAAVCDVTATVNPYLSPSDNTDTKTYRIAERNNIGQLFGIRLAEGAAATNISTMEKIRIGFAEGAATETVGLCLNIDEESVDELNIYDTADIVIDFCGLKYTIRYMDLDAAS